MGLFTDDELADLASEQLAAMPDTCTITRPQRMSDHAGGETNTSTVVGAVACRYEPESRRAVVAVVAGAVVTLAYWTFTMPAGTDVRAGDLLTVGARTFAVAGVLGPTSYQLALRVRAHEQE